MDYIYIYVPPTYLYFSVLLKKYNFLSVCVAVILICAAIFIFTLTWMFCVLGSHHMCHHHNNVFLHYELYEMVTTAKRFSV